jgi:hypothetical protein
MRINHLRRRQFITVLGGAAVAWPIVAGAQQPERMRRIDVLMAYAESDPEGQALVAAFREGLQKLGWTESRNVRIETRWATADLELMQRFATEIVALQPDLILTQNTPTTAAMLQQTRSIPIIFATGRRALALRVRAKAEIPVRSGRRRTVIIAVETAAISSRHAREEVRPFPGGRGGRPTQPSGTREQKSSPDAMAAALASE